MQQRHTARSIVKLSKNSEYRQLYKNGRLIKNSILWLYLLPASDGKIDVGVSVSSNINKKATIRNKLKRIIKEWFRKNKDFSAKGYKIAIVVKRPVAMTKRDSKIIKEELANLFVYDEKYNTTHQTL